LDYIIDLELSKVRERLSSRKITLEVSSEAKAFLTDKGYNPDFGARPLRRAIAQYIEDPLAERLLSGDFPDGTAISASRQEGNEYLSFVGVAGDSNKPKELPAASGT
jgi:ATP-dependent Clp protease ATP-binding subunit ClpB